jgi:hypothetical protein
MSRMLELVRRSAVPSHMMQTAARGALAVPPAEMIEILVHLALHNKVFCDKARMTLAGWDEAACRTVVGDPQTSKEVLNYFAAGSNLRPALLPTLLENPSVSDSALSELAGSQFADVIDIFLQSPRTQRSGAISGALRGNHNLSDKQAAVLKAKLAGPVEAAPAEDKQDADGAVDQVVHAFIAEHATEIAAEPQKPFQAVGGIEELPVSAAVTTVPALTQTQVPSVAVANPSSGAAVAATPAKAHPGAAAVRKTFLSAEEQRGSALQKISRLDVQGRIQLAIKGNKEERSLLIRDGTKLVALAVLESPKISDGEVEKFAGQKNVLEAVLRAIPMKRRFAKLYPVLRNLVFNPRTPIDLSLGIMKHIQINDLRNLSGNKEVPDTIRKLALKMFKMKTDLGNKH